MLERVGSGQGACGRASQERFYSVSAAHAVGASPERCFERAFQERVCSGQGAGLQRLGASYERPMSGSNYAN